MGLGGRRLAAGTFIVLVVGVLGSWLLAAALPVPRAPLGLRAWLPLPVACVDLRCVTYRRVAALRARGEGRPAPADVLADLLTRRAADIVARRSALAVSEGEVDAALATVGELAADDAALQRFLATQYGNVRSTSFREGMREILLRRKLAAAGIPDVWATPLAPSVLLLHFRYRWDAREHRVVER